MANEKNDISEVVKKCKILLLDIEGTTTSISFVKDKLFPYAEENVKDFLDNEWESEDVKEAVAALRKLALEDEEKKVDGVVTIPAEDASKDEQIEGLVKSVKWQMSLDRKVGPLKQLQGLIWKKGYDKGDIKGHVYDDVSPALELWRSVEGQKVYIYSSGSVQAQKLLFGMSSAGDLLKLIDGHFDTAVGAKQEATSYTAIAEKIGCKAEEILFLTDIDKEAEAARLAGVQAALVSREGNAPLSEAITSSYPVLYSFTELAATKKRKPDAQDVQQPAKVLKTDVETNVKTPIETAPPENTSELAEKMEVEEDVVAKEDTPAGKLSNEAVEKIKTTVEEITGSKEVDDIIVSDAKPIIIESTETKEKDTEMMESEPVEVVNSVSNGDKDACVAEETPAVITEIKDITNDKESLSEGTEIIEDLVPIVEEPAAQDMEDLQNVGEVLEKECDEILSKVQDVTNLDNIPLKTLHPIAEETMETENMDTNDIVEGILDKEQELEMKKRKDIDLNTVQDICAAKPATDSDKTEAQAVTHKKSEPVVPEKPLESTVEEANITGEVKEPKLDAGSPEEKEKKDGNLLGENVKETKRVEEEQMKTDLTENNVEKTNLTKDITEKDILPEDKINKPSPIQENAKESNQTEENVNRPKEETIAENNQAEKTDNNLSAERVKESSDTEEKIKDNGIIEDKAKEKSVSEEKVKESSITREKIKDIISAEQKLEDGRSVELENEKNKTTVDEVKIAERYDDSKMETDVSTADSKDCTDLAKEKKTDDKSKTAEIQVQGEKSDAHSTKSSIETNEIKLSEESSMEIDQTKTLAETKISEKKATASITEVVQPDNDSKETQVNGKTTNGDADMVDLNGDASKDDELSSRLSMENGKEVVNGAKDDSVLITKSENNGDDVSEVADIKVKTVAMDEPRTDPIEQPTEV